MTAHDLAEGIGDRNEQSAALRYAADAHYLNREPERALDLEYRALDLAEKAAEHDGYVQALVGIGKVLAGMDRRDEAIEQFRHTLDEIPRRPLAAAPEQIARLTAAVFLGSVLAEAERWPEVFDAARFALPLAEKFGEPQLLGTVHLTLGRAHAAIGDATRARTELHAALALFRMRGSTGGWVARAEAALAGLDVPASA